MLIQTKLYIPQTPYFLAVHNRDKGLHKISDPPDVYFLRKSHTNQQND